MNGNVVVGFATDSVLMLDADHVEGKKLVKWCREYTKTFNLGDVEIWKTSVCEQLDILGNKLPDNYYIVFGRAPLHWQDIVLHIENAFEDGIVNEGFLKMRRYGLITERINAKNLEKSYPTPYKYIKHDGVDGGIKQYSEWWRWNKEIGCLTRKRMSEAIPSKRARILKK